MCVCVCVCVHVNVVQALQIRTMLLAACSDDILVEILRVVWGQRKNLCCHHWSDAGMSVLGLYLLCVASNGVHEIMPNNV